MLISKEFENFDESEIDIAMPFRIRFRDQLRSSLVQFSYENPECSCQNEMSFYATGKRPLLLGGANSNFTNTTALITERTSFMVGETPKNEIVFRLTHWDHEIAARENVDDPLTFWRTDRALKFVVTCFEQQAGIERQALYDHITTSSEYRNLVTEHLATKDIPVSHRAIEPVFVTRDVKGERKIVSYGDTLIGKEPRDSAVLNIMRLRGQGVRSRATQAKIG